MEYLPRLKIMFNYIKKLYRISVFLKKQHTKLYMTYDHNLHTHSPTAVILEYWNYE